MLVSSCSSLLLPMLICSPSEGSSPDWTLRAPLTASAGEGVLALGAADVHATVLRFVLSFGEHDGLGLLLALDHLAGLPASQGPGLPLVHHFGTWHPSPRWRSGRDAPS